MTLGSGPTIDIIPAGEDVGESLPTGVVGQTGFQMNSDDSVDYWAVLPDGGTFAVGLPLDPLDPPTPPTDPPA